MLIKDYPFISIVIPTYKDWERLGKCLKALNDQTYPIESFEIIVVNNCPDDFIPYKLEIPENCRILLEKSPGSYAARNLGIKSSKGELIGFTDSDCIPDLNWIKNAVIFFNKNPEILRLGGSIKIINNNSKPSYSDLYDKIFAFPQKEYVKSGNAVTANMFTYKYIFDVVGLFNEKLMSGGDYQWGMLAHKGNFKIGYDRKVIVRHPARESINELIIKAKRVGEGRAGFIKKEKIKPYNFLAILKLLQPRMWEIKKVLKKGKELNFIDKIFLVALRHYLLLLGDFTMYNRRRTNIHEK